MFYMRRKNRLEENMFKATLLHLEIVRLMKIRMYVGIGLIIITSIIAMLII